MEILNKLCYSKSIVDSGLTVHNKLYNRCNNLKLAILYDSAAIQKRILK